MLLSNIIFKLSSYAPPVEKRLSRVHLAGKAPTTMGFGKKKKNVFFYLLENRQFVIEVNPERENGKIYSGMEWKIND